MDDAGPLLLPLEGRKQKPAEVVARAILARAAEDRLNAGDQLPPVTEMVVRFGVGCATMREALRTLEVTGLIEHRPGPGGGYVFCGSSPREFGRVLTLHLHALRLSVADLLAARALIEPGLAALAAASGDAAAHARLAEALRGSDLAADGAFQSHSVDFHRCVLGMSGRRAVELWALALQDVSNLRMYSEYSEHQRRDLAEDHRQIGVAILDRDSELARRRMADHFDRITAYVRAASGSTPVELTSPVEWR